MLSVPFRYVLVIAAAAITLFATGCGDTVIDASKAEDTIQANVEKSRHEKITSVDCPSGQKVEPGETFNCTIDFSNGKHAIVTLKIRNSDADTDMVGFKETK